MLFAAAAALVLLVALPTVLDRRATVPVPVLRGDRDEAPRLQAPITLPDGGLILSWSPSTSSDAYRVQLYDESLGLLAQPAATVDTFLRLDPSHLEATTGEATPRFWSVTAMLDGDPAGESKLLPLPSGDAK